VLETLKRHVRGEDSIKCFFQLLEGKNEPRAEGAPVLALLVSAIPSLSKVYSRNILMDSTQKYQRMEENRLHLSVAPSRYNGGGGAFKSD
jgi:hypothetical protein